jgi:4-alpha-glucanotransferase
MQDKKAGIYIPVFSLRSRDSLGVGEFTDLKKLADWGYDCGFALIQILPVQDTSLTGSWLDSYPYSLLSAFALHPIYLRIEQAFSYIPEEVQKEIKIAKEQLNALEELDYEAVYKMKFRFFEKLYPLNAQQTFSSPPFQAFIQQNEAWLPAYAAFCSLRDSFGTCDFSSWTKYSVGDVGSIKEICSPSSDYYLRVQLYYYLQFHLHVQFKEASLYAETKGICLKGDFPVGVHMKSVETWSHPELFITKKTIGAPPDYFNTLGQNWGFPTYNWTEAEKNQYSWFVQRLSHMEQYCKIVRIDHVLGYFRLWEIQTTYLRGNMGYFQPSHSISLDQLPLAVRNHLDRYCMPFITEDLLDRLFKERKGWIASRFFENGPDHSYRFQEKFKNQKNIEETADISDQERRSLHELFENVLLIRDTDKLDTFYPRIGLENTESFRNLKPSEQEYFKSLQQLYFSKEQDLLWEQEALKKLKIFQQATHMEICAEDLGMVPACTERVLKELSFLRLFIQRMPKAAGEEFTDFSEFDFLSVCSPSNHDTSTLRQWWREDFNKSQRYYNTILKESGEAPREANEELCRKIIKMHLESQSKWAIFLIQDLLSVHAELKKKGDGKERINYPSISQFYWKYRLHINLEDLIQRSDFSSSLRSLLLESGRISRCK